MSNRTVTLSLLALGVLFMVPARGRAQGTGGGAGAGAAKQVIVPAGGRASATLSPGIRVGNLLFLSGQLPGRGTGADTTIQEQTTRTLNNIKGLLDAAGAKVEDVVKCTVFLINGADFQGMNQAYTQFFTKEPPARSTVVVAALVSPGAKLEIECIAAMK